MRYTFILLFIVGSYNAAFSQKSKPVPATVISRYYSLTGAIDKYPVTVHLYRINDEFRGHYYYNSTEEAIDISGKLGKDRFLKLAAHDHDGNETEVLSGNFKDSSFSGTWSFKGKVLPFRIAQKQDNSGLTFDYIYTAGSKELPKDENNRSELSYDAATIWPAPSASHSAIPLVKEIIYKDFGEKQGKDPIGKVMLREKNSILNPTKQDEETPTYALYRRVEIAYRSSQLITFSNHTYFDGGGVHGNFATFYTCIDLVHNRELTIADVLDTLTCKQTLQGLLAKKFRAVYNVKKEEKISEYLFNDTISPNNNIMLTSKGIGFNYTPYEIGAYALGEIFLYIPYKELGNCLKPEFKQLIGISSQ